MTIFISRELSSDSVFRQMLEDKATIIDQSLLGFEAIEFDRIPEADWLFFYSKNGIKYTLSQLSSTDGLPAVAVFGRATANYLKTHYNIEADFVGNGKPEETAAQFLEVSAGQKVVFLQAQNSRQSIQKLMGKQINSTCLVVYDNSFKVDVEIPDAEILVFTSPMNVQAYFSKKTLLDGQTCISIGTTTAQELKQFEIKKLIIADQANEEALAKCCLSIIDN
jgi:uroporphyrinogen-III synthase